MRHSMKSRSAHMTEPNRTHSAYSTQMILSSLHIPYASIISLSSLVLCGIVGLLGNITIL